MQPDATLRRTARARSGVIVLFAAHVLNYLTNHIVNHIPSYAVRRAWYSGVMGIEMGDGAAVQLGCYLWSYGPRSNRRNRTSIGARTIVNRQCCLDARSGLRIGDDVSVSPEVAILTTQHDVDHPGFPLQGKSVVIEDNVWIGMRAIILPGVRIGRGAVVAAGAVVTRDVASLDIVAGAPAHPIGRRRIDPAYELEAPPLFE